MVNKILRKFWEVDIELYPHLQDGKIEEYWCRYYYLNELSLFNIQLKLFTPYAIEFYFTIIKV